jgi:hypothetical protein
MVYSYGVVENHQTKIIQIFQSKVLHSVTNATLYVSNFTLHNDL